MNEFDLVLPTTVDVREVGMRDGLQLEEPVPLDAKLEMLEALVATGVRRIEATSFVSPKAVPALADADQVAAELSRWDGVLWSALVANARGAVRAVDSGVPNLEYVVSASDGHSRANAGRSTAEAVAAVAEIAALAHGAGGDRGSCDIHGAGDGRATVERAVPGGGDDDLQGAARTVRQRHDLVDEPGAPLAKRRDAFEHAVLALLRRRRAGTCVRGHAVSPRRRGAVSPAIRCCCTVAHS